MEVMRNGSNIHVRIRSNFRRGTSTTGCRRPRFSAAALLGLLCVGAAAVEPPGKYDVTDLKALQEAFVRVAEEVQPSVAIIRTFRTFETGEQGQSHVKIPLSQGSGFIIDADGYLATNRHVIEDADVITVRLFDNSVYDAVVQQTDPRSDLAVLRIDAEHLKPVRWGEAAGVKVGQWAFACGNPFGLANGDGRASVTIGVISAMGRQLTSRLVGDSAIEYYGNLLETSAVINPGNSGGPLFGLSGELIGVVTAIETGANSGEGRGFAIPVDRNIRRVLAELKAGRRVRYGFLGVEVEEVEAPAPGALLGVRTVPGALIREIRLANGPAAQAGLKPRDVVIEFDGVAVENSDHLVRLVGFTPVGTGVAVTFLRAGVKRRTTVVVGDRAELLGITSAP
jgi:serine protease Do